MFRCSLLAVVGYLLIWLAILDVAGFVVREVGGIVVLHRASFPVPYLRLDIRLNRGIYTRDAFVPRPRFLSVHDGSQWMPATAVIRRLPRLLRRRYRF